MWGWETVRSWKRELAQYLERMNGDDLALRQYV